jgi:hypothetical protein
MVVDDVRLDDRGEGCELSARVSRTALATDGERIWFRFPNELRPPQPDASPYLPGLLLACMRLGEPLVIDGPVSPRLLSGAQEAKGIYRGWYPRVSGGYQRVSGGYLGVSDVPIKAEPHAPAPAKPAAGCFFTRGVDSWYSALNGMAGAAAAPAVPITNLIYSPTADFVVGRPTEAWKREVRATAAERTREACKAIGCDLVLVDSNMRELVEPTYPWGFTHGAMLASLGLALGLARVHIPGTVKGSNSVPHGSHPQVDPLWSTERTEIVHDRADVTRPEKVRFLADRPEALDRLKVCINQSAEANCGRCPKCVRTMVALRLAEPLDGSPSFDQPLRLRRVALLPSRYDLERASYREVRAAAERAGGHAALRVALRCAGALGRLPTPVIAIKRRLTRGARELWRRSRRTMAVRRR